MCRAPSPNRRRVVQCLDGGQHPVEVEQRLTHAHEHDVRQPLPGRDQPARRRPHLVDDLGHLEVAPEAELAGRTERAADRAAGLARDAQRVTLARSGPGRVMHQDQFDEGTVSQPVERLLGQPAIRLAHLGIGDRVEAERRRRGPRAAAAGSVLMSAAVRASPRHTASPIWRARYAGSPRSTSQAVSSSVVRPEIPGRSSRVTSPMLAHDCRRSPDVLAATLPRSSARLQPAAPRRVPGAAHHRRQGLARRTRRSGGRWTAPRSTTRRRSARRPCRRTSPATADRPGPGVRARRPAARDPAGRPRGVSRRVRLAPSTGCSLWRDLAPQPGSEGVGQKVCRDLGQPRLEVRRRFVPRQRLTPAGDDRARVESLVHAHQADSRLGVAGEDRRRDRRRPAMARKERWVQVERPVREVQQRRRDKLAVVGQDGESGSEPEHRGDRLGRAQPLQGQDRRDVRGCGRQPRSRVGVSTWRRPASRGGAVTTPTSSTSGCSARRRRAGIPNAPLPRKTVRTREPPARPSVTPGRSSPRGPPRRPRSKHRPPSARPSTRDSRCTACRQGGRARAGAPGPAVPSRRP